MKAALSGAEGARTPDLLHAMQALSQLSYSPAAGSGATTRPRLGQLRSIKPIPHPGKPPAATRPKASRAREEAVNAQ